ncbi:hypothetical protein [Flavobacterium aquicola]|nr:hypothetical protein [Flavobacterium aquicola]
MNEMLEESDYGILNEPNSEYQKLDPGYKAFLKYLQKGKTIDFIKKC